MGEALDPSLNITPRGRVREFCPLRRSSTLKFGEFKIDLKECVALARWSVRVPRVREESVDLIDLGRLLVVPDVGDPRRELRVLETI